MERACQRDDTRQHVRMEHAPDAGSLDVVTLKEARDPRGPRAQLAQHFRLGRMQQSFHRSCPQGAIGRCIAPADPPDRSEEHTSELQSLMRTSYAVFCLKKKKIDSYKQ